MGRWGKGIYDSDTALDYHSTITSLLDREIAYWMAPENIFNSSFWLAQVLAVIELMLIFEYQDMGSSNVYISTVEGVKRWRSLFLGVWDGDWLSDSIDSYPYSTPEQRQQQRPGVIALFDCLESIAQLWEDLDNNIRSEVKPMPPEYLLPYLSLIRWTSTDNQQRVRVDRFTNTLLDQLLKDIFYWFSPERKSRVVSYGIEKVWVAVDNLGFLCEIYEQSPDVDEQTVRGWCDAADQISLKSFGDSYWNESNPLYGNVMRAFDRLEAVARKHPPTLW